MSNNSEAQTQIRQLIEGTATDSEIIEFLENSNQEQVYYLIENLANPETIKILLNLAVAKHSKAQEILGGLEKPEGRAVIADIFIDSGSKAVLEVCLRASHKPQNPQRLAVFYALTERRYELEQLDPDYKLLAEAFAEAPKGLQRRIMNIFRKTGRADVFRKLVIFEQTKKQKHSNKDTTSSSLREKIDQLKKAQAWQELWELVNRVSPDWSMIILHELSTTKWQPFKLEDKFLFEKLAVLARKYAGLSNIEFATSEPIRLQISETDSIYYNKLSYDGKQAAYFNELDSFRVFDIEKQKTIYNHGIGDALHEPETHFYSLTEDSSGILADFTEYIDGYKTGGELVSFGENWLWFSTQTHVIWLFRKQANQTNIKIECVGLSRNPDWVSGTQNGELLIIKYSTNTQEWFELINIETKQVIGESDSFTDEEVSEFTISLNGEVLAVVFAGGLICLYRLPNFELITNIEIWQREIKNLTFSPDGKLLAIGQPVLQIWDVENGTLSSDFFNPQTQVVHGNLIFQPDGEALVFDSGYKKIELLTKAGQTITLCNTVTWIENIAFTEDSRQLRILEDDGGLLSWSSLPIYMYNLSVEKGEYSDFLQLQELAANKELPREQRLWIKFIELCHSLKWRYEIQLDFIANVAPDDLDIELE